MVVNEAMHAGLPVIATDTVGAAAGGLVRDGRNGFVVPDVSASLAAAMRRILTDRDLSSYLGRQARADVSDFNYGRMADAFLAAVELAIEAEEKGGHAPLRRPAPYAQRL